MSAIAPPARARLRGPVIWGWRNTATVYALGLAVIASVYIGFAVADGRWIVLAVESGVTSAFIIIAAAEGLGDLPSRY